MWMPALALVACGPGGVTSEGTLAGRVLGPSGAPVEGLLVRSLEGQDRTDAEGRFAIEVKPPDQLAHFTSRGLWYQRTVAPADQGQVVELRLPPTRASKVVCPPQACDLRLVWSLAPRFEAHLRHGCAPGAEVDLDAAPVDTPTVECTVGKGKAARPIDLRVVDLGDTLRLVSPGRPVPIELRARDGGLPDDCVVRIGDRVAAASGPGSWLAEVSGKATIVASCAGRPAPPATMSEPGAEGVVIEWSPSGPDLDLEGVAPWATEAVVVAEEAGWTLSLAPTSQGFFRLPPLPAGTYRVLVRGDGVDLPLLADPPAPSGDGVLTVKLVGDRALVGRMGVVDDLEAGPVRVSVDEG